MQYLFQYFFASPLWNDSGKTENLVFIEFTHLCPGVGEWGMKYTLDLLLNLMALPGTFRNIFQITSVQNVLFWKWIGNNIRFLFNDEKKAWQRKIAPSIRDEKLPEILSQWQQKSQLLTRFARSSDKWFLLKPLLRISYRQFFTCGIVIKNKK